MLTQQGGSGFFCTFFQIAILHKVSGLCELSVRLLGTKELPQAITETCLQVVHVQIVCTHA